MAKKKTTVKKDTPKQANTKKILVKDEINEVWVEKTVPDDGKK